MRLDLRENDLAALKSGRESLVGFSFYFRVIYIRYYEKRIICINRDLGWSEKGGEHVGFECG